MASDRYKKIMIGMAAILLIAFQTHGQNAPPPAKVRIAKVVEESRTENSGLVGVLYYDRVSNLSTEVSGRVRQADHRSGSRVNQNDLLVRIGTDFYDQDIAVEKAKIEAIGVKIKNVAKDLARYQSLLEKKAVSESAYDTLFFNHQILMKERDTLRAGLARIRLKRAKCEINAPYDGIILDKSVDTGDWVTPGRTLYRLAAIDDLFVKVAVSEKAALYSLPGTTVDVKLTAVARDVTGRIEGILPVADQKTKNITIKVRLMNPQAMGPIIAENMSATVYLPTSAPKTLKLIPRDALVNRPGGQFIYTVKDKKAAMLSVNVVAFFNEKVGVDDPHITAGMSVIVDGNERLQPEQAVTIDGKDS